MSIAIRRSLKRGQPASGDARRTKVTKQLGLQHTFRPHGRPKESEISFNSHLILLPAQEPGFESLPTRLE